MRLPDQGKRTSWPGARSIFFLILAFGLFVRLYHWDQNFPFGPDQFHDTVLLRNMYADIRVNGITSLPLSGQEGTYPVLGSKTNASNPVYNGVMYNYLLILPAVLGEFRIHSLVIFSLVLGIVSIYLAYKAGTNLFGPGVGLLFSFFIASSFWMAEYSRTVLSATPTPFFVLLALYAYSRVKNKESYLWPLFAFAVSASSQSHNSGYLFFVFVCGTSG